MGLIVLLKSKLQKTTVSMFNLTPASDVLLRVNILWTFKTTDTIE